MKELINFLTDWGDISVGVVFVLIPFSAFVALFHHVILGGIYGWDYKHKNEHSNNPRYISSRYFARSEDGNFFSGFPVFSFDFS